MRHQVLICFVRCRNLESFIEIFFCVKTIAGLNRLGVVCTQCGLISTCRQLLLCVPEFVVTCLHKPFRVSFRPWLKRQHIVSAWLPWKRALKDLLWLYRTRILDDWNSSKISVSKTKIIYNIYNFKGRLHCGSVALWLKTSQLWKLSTPFMV